MLLGPLSTPVGLLLGVAAVDHSGRVGDQLLITALGWRAGELRNLYRLAVRDGLISDRHNPALAVPLPRRLPSTRRALTTSELAEINHVVAAGGRDPVLDSLLIRLHTETACRRGGALALRLQDLDARYCRVLLREKGGTYRWQPITPTLANALVHHAAVRGASDPSDGLLRQANGASLTTRRYDLLRRVLSSCGSPLLPTRSNPFVALDTE